MKISVIVPAGRPETASDTVRSILAQDQLPDHLEIVLVGAGLAELERKISDSRLRLVPLEKRLNPARTRIKGVEKASGDIYLFVDDDIELDPSFVKNLDRIIRQKDKLGAVGARLPGKSEKYFSRVTDYTNFWSQQSRVSGKREWLYSAVLAVPAEVYHQVGGFDPGLEVGEDVDLTTRILHAGYPVFYDASLVGHHNHHRETFCSAVSYFWHNGRLAKYQFQQNPQGRRWFGAGVVLRNFVCCTKNMIVCNSGELLKIFPYLPGIILMYAIFSVSLEVHYQRYAREHASGSN